MTGTVRRARQRAPQRRLAITAVVLVGTIVGPAHTVSAQSASPPLPPATVHDLTPSIRDLSPRIVDIRPAVTKAGTDTSVTVSSDVLFAFGRSDLSSDAQAVLSDVVKALQSASAGPITVTGYTDAIGADAFNLNLSRARAEAVHAFLAAQVSRSDLTYRVVGKGKADPVAPNANPDGSDSPDGRRKNRRVTLTFRA